MNVHEASKFKVCRWCCAKVGNIKISSHRLLKETAGEFTQLGEQYTRVFEPLSADRNCPRPNVLCTTCKLYIAKVVGGYPPTKQPNRFNWPHFLHETRSTCSLNDKCPMCKEATRFGRRSLAKSDISHTKPGRPMTNSPTKVVKHCSKCLSEISQGISHQCTKRSLIDNTHQYLAHRNVLDQYASLDMLQRLEERDASTLRLELPRPERGYALIITASSSSHFPPQPKSKKQRIEFGKIMQLKSTGEVSNNQFKRCLQF